jgi:hypothetical protein
MAETNRCGDAEVGAGDGGGLSAKLGASRPSAARMIAPARAKPRRLGIDSYYGE